MDTELQYAVFARDGGCVAALLDAPDPCQTKEGRAPGHQREDYELDHVRSIPPFGALEKPSGHGGFGKRPADDLDHLVVLCWHHHQGGWATAHRNTLRVYLAMQRLKAELADANQALDLEYGP